MFLRVETDGVWTHPPFPPPVLISNPIDIIFLSWSVHSHPSPPVDDLGCDNYIKKKKEEREDSEWENIDTYLRYLFIILSQGWTAV
jgi:hypothetical protein